MLERRTPEAYWFAALLCAILLLAPSLVNAQHLSAADYEQNLHRAIEALEELETMDEAESPYYYQNELTKALATVREAVPVHQSVQSSDEVCNVDNTWLHEALTELEKANAEKRPDHIVRVIERLVAVEERVAYERRAATDADNKVYTKGKLESILARPEYAPQAQGPNALTRLIRDFVEWLEKLLPKPVRAQSSGSRWPGLLAQVVVVIAALLVVLYVGRILVRRFGVSPRKRIAKKRSALIILGEQLKPEDTASDLLSEAEALARQGELRAAIRKAYVALLVELGDRNLITLAQHKTNRDYLNSVKNIPPLHTTMRSLTDSFELHWYGFAEATENDWNNFRSRYHKALQKQN
jgi:hypothetical protein